MMGEIENLNKKSGYILYSLAFCVMILSNLLWVNCVEAYAYKAISPAMEDYITEEEEKITVVDTNVSDTVTQTVETTNQSKFYEVILNEECDTEEVTYTKSYANYANVVADKVLSGEKVVSGNAKNIIITDKTKSLSVVGINNFNVQLKYGMSMSELELFQRIVQAEAGGEDLKGKILVANVILNRVKSPKFPNNLRSVIMAKRQFQPVTTGRIYTVKVSSETKLAVDMALAGEDYSNGALYFMARSASTASNVTWFDRALTKVLKHGNHEFFK